MGFKKNLKFNCIWLDKQMCLINIIVNLFLSKNKFKEILTIILYTYYTCMLALELRIDNSTQQDSLDWE